MNPPIFYDAAFPHLHLALNQIHPDTIDSIPQWIAHLTESIPQAFHQIDLDASHPRFPTILSTLLPTLSKDNRLSYIHITQSDEKHLLRPAMLQVLIHAVRDNQNYPNITIQVNCDDCVKYY